MLPPEPAEISGVDGCKGGNWIAVIATPGSFDKAEVKIFQSAAALLSELAPRSVIAIDVPIGLPERTINGAREPDWAARAFLGPRRMSVFPVPSRKAVYAHAQGYAQVCVTACETSDPPKAVSKQLFGILPRILEVDSILRGSPALRRRVFEVHPEVSFQVMNNDVPLLEPKKVKGRINLPGMELRKELLEKEGFSPQFLSRKPPPEA